MSGMVAGGWTGVVCGPPAFLVVALSTLSAPDAVAVVSAAIKEAGRLTIRAVFCGELAGYGLTTALRRIGEVGTGTSLPYKDGQTLQLLGAGAGVIFAFAVCLFVGAIQGGLRETRTQKLMVEIEAMRAGADSSTL